MNLNFSKKYLLMLGLAIAICGSNCERAHAYTVDPEPSSPEKHSVYLGLEAGLNASFKRKVSYITVVNNAKLNGVGSITLHATADDNVSVTGELKNANSMRGSAIAGITFMNKGVALEGFAFYSTPMQFKRQCDDRKAFDMTGLGVGARGIINFIFGHVNPYLGLGGGFIRTEVDDSTAALVDSSCTDFQISPSVLTTYNNITVPIGRLLGKKTNDYSPFGHFTIGVSLWMHHNIMTNASLGINSSFVKNNFSSSRYTTSTTNTGNSFKATENPSMRFQPIYYDISIGARILFPN